MAQEGVRAWEHCEAASRLLALAAVTDAELLACLRAIHQELENRGQGSGGVRPFYDCGLAAICDALEARA